MPLPLKLWIIMNPQMPMKIPMAEPIALPTITSSIGMASSGRCSPKLEEQSLANKQSYSAPRTEDECETMKSRWLSETQWVSTHGQPLSSNPRVVHSLVPCEASPRQRGSC